MNYHAISILLLIGVSGVVHGMDVEEHFFFQGPSDLQPLILKAAWDVTKKQYHMATYGEELLCIPYTVRPIKPVAYSTVGEAQPTDWVPALYSDILLDHQLGYDGGTTVRLEEDTANNHDNFSLSIPQLEGNRTSMFDGSNQKRCALFVLNSDSQSVLYFLRQSQPGVGIVNRGSVDPLLDVPAYLNAVMLHTDENRIIYSLKRRVGLTTPTDCKGAVVGDIAVPIAPPLPYSLHIIDVGDDNAVKTIAEKDLNILLEKTVYVGENSYFGFTTEGKLVRIWLDDTNQIGHAMITLTKYDDTTKSYVPSSSVIKDIAVDDSYRTEAGFRPRIAYLTTQGELFVMDFTCAFNKPTPIFNKKLKNPACIFRLFYDKGELAVLYRIRVNLYTDFKVWPDNIGQLYLKTVLAKKRRVTQE